MGIDITWCTERRRPEGTWERVDPLIPNDELEIRYGDTVPGKVYGSLYDEIIGRRDPTLFGLLAEGLYLNGDYRLVGPIVPERGLPEDAAPETRWQYEDDGGVGCSWALLRELQDFDWRQPAKRSIQVVVYREPAEPWDPYWLYGPGWYYDRRTEQVELCQLVGDFLVLLLPALRRLGHPEEVRAVYWFNT